MAASLSRTPLVEFAELDYIVHATITPNDPDYSWQWGLPKIQAPEAWNESTGGPEVIIAIVDTGVDLNHPDLNDKILPGRDFVNGDYIAQDDHGHGTHVAGIAAAETNNGLGVAGVSWGALILPIKVLNQNGDGYYSDVARGVRYACNHGAKVINLSLGGSSPSQTLEDALEDVAQQGCLVTAAAGNDGENDDVDYPARYAETIAVAATNNSDLRASFSDYGPEVDVAAPGVSIYSTFWTPSSHTYGYKDGTSMSTAYVSGLAAVVWSFCPELSAGQVRAVIEVTAKDLGDPGWDDEFGHGRIDAAAAVAQAGPPPVLAVDQDRLIFLADATHGPWPQTLLVSNDAPCRWLDWSAVGSQDWVEADPVAGQASYVLPQEIDVSVDKSGLAHGVTYSAIIAISSDTLGVLESPQQIEVQFIYSDTSLQRIFYPLGMSE
jgi:subtilisin family serine protease